MISSAFRWIKQKIYSYPLNLQINIAIGVIILITIFLILTITYVNTFNQTKENFKETGLLILQETMDKINSRLKLAENTAIMISNDSRILNYTYSSNSTSEAEISRYLNNCLDFNKYDTHEEGLAYIENLIDDIIFISEKSIIITRKLNFTSYNIRRELNNEWFKKAYFNKGRLIWSDYFYNSSSEQLVKSTSSELNSRLNQFMLIRYIVNEKTSEDVGYIALSINFENLSRLIDNIKVGKAGNLFVIDNKGTILACEDRAQILKTINFDGQTMKKVLSTSSNINFFEGKIDNRNYFIFHAPLSINNWKLVLTIPVKELEESVSSTLFSISIVGVLSFIVITAISTLVLNNMSHPLKEILASIKQTRDGNLSQKVDVQGCMEVKQLSTEFNFMLDKINSLLERIVEEQKVLRKAELKALRAQINPHFLYNTLDSIKWLICSGDGKKASELATSLSTFFRLSLSGGNEEIPIRDEVEHVRHYLFIQKLRCGDNMNYILDIDAEIENFKTPKLILQPIVENALFHGLNKKEGAGLIKIVAKRKDEQTIIFEVFDDGLGMSPEELDSLNQRINDPLLQSTAGSHGYAIRNVNQRIKLSYGDKYGIHYKSKYNVGTKVSVTIPVIG